MQELWLKALAKEEIDYFHATDCKSVSGPFRKLIRKYRGFDAAKKIADGIRLDLETILLSFPWVGFGIGVDIQSYHQFRQEQPLTKIFFSEDPTVQAYTRIMYQVTNSTRREAPGHSVAFVIDQSSYDEKIIHAFNAMKVQHPIISNSIATLTPLSTIARCHHCKWQIWLRLF